MRRVKLGDLKKEPSGNGLLEVSDAAYGLPPASSSVGWKTVEEGDEGGRTEDEDEEDHMLEEMLRKRRQSVMEKKKHVMEQQGAEHPSATDDLTSDEPSAASREHKKSGGNVNFAGRGRDSFGGGSTASSTHSISQSESSINLAHHLQGSESINTFLKERILYHGPIPYMEK
jgi:hypothetical protein